jgi:hypothetical protein
MGQLRQKKMWAFKRQATKINGGKKRNAQKEVMYITAEEKEIFASG